MKGVPADEGALLFRIPFFIAGLEKYHPQESVAPVPGVSVGLEAFRRIHVHKIIVGICDNPVVFAIEDRSHPWKSDLLSAVGRMAYDLRRNAVFQEERILPHRISTVKKHIETKIIASVRQTIGRTCHRIGHCIREELVMINSGKPSVVDPFLEIPEHMILK